MCFGSCNIQHSNNYQELAKICSVGGCQKQQKFRNQVSQRAEKRATKDILMKKIIDCSKNFKEFFLNSSKRKQIVEGWKNTKVFSIKRTVGLTAFIYVGGSAYFLSNTNEEFSLKEFNTILLHEKVNLSRNVSRLSGWFADKQIPVGLRRIMYGSFAKAYGVIEEDMVEPYENYESFNAFFTRKVKPRDIGIDEDIIVSPADSKVLTISEVKGDSNVLIKGVNYKMGEFLTGRKEVVLEDDMFKTLKIKNPESKIYQAIFYLNPGDYHRYHSPSTIIVKRRNHILGYLAPVKESYISTHERVYEGNERVAIFGEWKHGQFTQVYVGATNVGSMTLEFDQEMKTNEKIDLKFKSFKKYSIKEFSLTNNDEKVEKTAQKRPDLQEFFVEELQAINDVGRTIKLPPTYKQHENGILIPKGAEIGRFNLGSTVVIFFEAKGDLNWLVKEGDKVRYGQPVCQVITPTILPKKK